MNLGVKAFNIRTKLMLLGLGCVFVTALALVLVGVWQGRSPGTRRINCH